MQMPQFVYPALLWLLIPIGIGLFWLVRKSFVQENSRFDDESSKKRRKHLRAIVFCTRFIVIAMLLLALATPLVTQSSLRAGDTAITLLIDESASMNLLDKDELPALIERLESEVPLTTHIIASGEDTPLGSAVLSYLKANENVLLITDGHSTSGASLAQVAAYAAQSNSTISAIKLTAKEFDAAIRIDAPAKTVVDTNTTFAVRISRTMDESVQVRISVDGEILYEESTGNEAIEITRSFTRGDHRISAELLQSDALVQNNRYDHVLTATEKPKILLVSQRATGLEQLFSQLYSVTSATQLPPGIDLSPYAAVVLVDVPLSAITQATPKLSSFVLEGNGLLVAGGPTSFEYSSYKSSAFESLLPVTVGRGAQREGSANIAIAMDLSGSVSGSYAKDPATGQLVYTKSDKPALVRGLALSVLEDIDDNNLVGSVVVGSQSKNASENLRADQLVSWDYVGGAELGRISLLGKKRAGLASAISTVDGGGQAPSQHWIRAPLQALSASTGSKNIIIITDGQSCTQNCRAAAGGSDEAQTIEIARTAAAQGAKIYVVGVKPGLNDDFLIALAQAGNGIYFPADKSNRLAILFGDPTKDEQSTALGLVAINPNHFITRDVDLTATLYGYNDVVPKTYSSQLVTGSNGKPVLTVWNYGVGRVATLTGYTGQDYGELLGRGNSLLLSRTGNWVIGDPERSASLIVTVPHFYLNKEGTVKVCSSAIPINSVLTFTPARRDDEQCPARLDAFSATLKPTQVGFGDAGGILYATTYLPEYEQVGFSEELAETLAISGGAVFEPDEADKIIEHVTTIRTLQELQKRPLRWPFLLIAAFVFLVEVAVRRFFEVTRNRRMG